MSWYIEIANCIKKEIRKIPKKDLEYIKNVIESMKTDPFIGDRQKLKGETDEYRRRVGNWRIFFKIDIVEYKIIIKHIRKRDSKTYNKKR